MRPVYHSTLKLHGDNSHASMSGMSEAMLQGASRIGTWNRPRFENSCPGSMPSICRAGHISPTH